MSRKLAIALAVLSPMAAHAAPISVLFVGNSYTFGRHDPVMSYNAANVTDLTAPERGGSFTNTTGSNAFEPHPWGGVAGIFKQFTVQAGLDYDVSLSTRNAASLRGHFLNLNPAGWDLRGNIALQEWNKVVVQEQSAQPLPRNTNASGQDLGSNPEFFRFYADRIENFIHSAAPQGEFRERDAFPGATNGERNDACAAATGSRVACTRVRDSFTNPNGSADTEVYLYQTWARPNLIDGAFLTSTDDITGAVTRSDVVSPNTHYADLESQTADLALSYEQAFAQARADGTPGFAAIAPVGQAFLRAVQSGAATRNMWADDALTDGLIDLWFDDGTHASTQGSYLSALVLFGTLTGLDPAKMGAGEIAARELGIGGDSALLLQRVASEQLGFVAPVPVPASGPLALLGIALMGLVARRRRYTA